ncbi:MAG: M42 family peptidase [Pseudomonadota bacterium]
MNPRELLDRLVEPLGPPGREDDVRALIRELVTPHAHKVEVDRMGNLQAWINPQARPLVMLDAHMDEVGLVVQRVEESGFLRIASLGGPDPRVLPGSRVILQPRPGRRVMGVVGLLPPHVEKAAEAEKALPWERLYVDLGVSGAAGARGLGVETGTPGVVEAGHGPLGQGCYYARNLDDRAGCVLLCAILERLAAAPPAFGVCCNFAVAEEVGLRGATTAAHHIAPDLALVLEATVGDTPGVDAARHPSLLGQGPAVTVADGRIVVPWYLVESLEEAAAQAGVAWQRKLPPYGGTDAGAIALSRGGVPTAVLSVPTRYIHTPVSLLNLADLEAMLSLALAWLETAGQLCGGPR